MPYLLIFFALCTILPSSSLFAQINEGKIEQYLNQRLATVSKANITVANPNSAEQVAQLLQQKLPNLQHKTALRLLQSTQSPLGTHYSFVQTIDGYDIYDATLRVSLNKKGEIYLISDRTFNCNNLILPPSAALKQNGNKAIEQFLKKNSLVRNETTNNKQNNEQPNIMLLFANEKTPIWVYSLKAETSSRSHYHQYLLNQQGEQLYQRDLSNDGKAGISPKNNHAHAHAANKLQTSQTKAKKAKTAYAKANTSTTEICEAYVYLPDPLTSAQKQYGATGFIDDNDGDSQNLSNERKVVEIATTLNNGVYSLENEYAKIIEYASPAAAPVTSTSPTFNFTRSQSGFEDVNAYYHLSNQAKYVLSLGFEMLKEEQVLIDTHAEQGDDQSRQLYDHNYKQHVIVHGEGGVDDAEDADVVVHEFGHALSYSACVDCNSGQERLALDEAIGDYFAGSYSYGFSDYRWKKVFSWDGQNPFFSGRDMGGDQHYPEDVVLSKIYTTSLIFSAALAEVMETLGKPATDSLVLASLYDWAAGIKLDDAAEIMILTDQTLMNGRNYNQLCYIFGKRGLYDGTCEVVANAGSDQTICLGDSIVIGQTAVPPANGTILWSPAIGLSSVSVANPTCSPNRTTTYALTVKNDQISLSDSVTINVQYCFTDTIGNSIKIYNTDRFYTGGDAVVEVPANTEQVSIQLFDVAGRLLKNISNVGDERIVINSSGLLQGTYILRVIADEQEMQFKLARIKQ
jgi:hypothetical protein